MWDFLIKHIPKALSKRISEQIARFERVESKVDQLITSEIEKNSEQIARIERVESKVDQLITSEIEKNSEQIARIERVESKVDQLINSEQIVWIERIESKVDQLATSEIEKNSEQTVRIERIERKIDHGLASRSIYLGNCIALTFLDSGNHRIFVDTRDKSIAPHLLTLGRWEPHITKLFSRLINKGDTVLDIGANFGYFSVIAAAYVGEKGKVVAFEANPYLCALLERTFKVNGMFRNNKAELYNKGVMNRAGELTLHINEDDFGGGTFLIPGKKSTLDNRRQEVVPVVALDEFLPPDFTADVVKMDIEGTEPLALQGMSQIIRRSSKIKLIIEYSPNRFKQHMSLNSFIDMIEELGLSIHFITKDGEQPANRDQILSSGFINLLLKS